VKVRIDLRMLAYDYAMMGKRFITLSDVQARLAVSRETAGRILAAMEKMGLVRRWSTRSYELLVAAEPPVGMVGDVGDEEPRSPQRHLDRPI